jgi:hypothetical protein
MINKLIILAFVKKLLCELAVAELVSFASELAVGALIAPFPHL